MKKTNIGFVGAGNMGFAIMKGISESEIKESVQLYAFDPNTSNVDRLVEHNVKPCKEIKDLVTSCKYVLLAVKPQIIEEVLESIASYVTSETIIISIAAGITDEFIAKKTIPNAKVILVMPNTPLLIGEGASALSHNENVTEEEFNLILNIFKICGKAVVISKNKMKEIIAINGSSPAFIYLFAKGFIDYAVENGIDSDAATILFSQSLIGSAKMITDSGQSIDELIKMVSSPGGTTLAGLDKLYDGKLTDVVKDCCENCTKRAYELSK